MPNVSRLDDEDDVLCNVGRVIANPFKMSRYQDEIDRGLDDPLIAEHVGDQLAENLVSQPIQPIVLFVATRLPSPTLSRLRSCRNTSQCRSRCTDS